MPSDPSHPEERADRELGPVDRRRFLSHVGAAGAGAIVTRRSSEITGANDRSEIAIVRLRDGPPVTTEVPDAWRESVQRSREVVELLLERYGDEDWFGSVGRGRGTDSIDGMRALTVTVYAENVAAAERALPEALDGFTIHVEEHREPVPHEDLRED